MPGAYIVCGPAASGNRLVAAILKRSGCDGSASTDQPKIIEDLPTPGDRPYVLVQHDSLSTWIGALRDLGFDPITAIIVIREPVANHSSMVRAGHVDCIKTAEFRRINSIRTNLADADEEDALLEIVTYEGLTEEMLMEWLPHIGLGYRSGPIILDGQDAPIEILSQNRKHYKRWL